MCYITFMCSIVSACHEPDFCRSMCRRHYARWNIRRKAGWPEPIDPESPMIQGRPPAPEDVRQEKIRARRKKFGQPASKKARERARPIVRAAKDQPCADCLGAFPYVCMDFDHVRGEKSFNISQAATSNIDVLLKEIEKCDVVCSNCHRIRSAKRMGLL